MSSAYRFARWHWSWCATGWGLWQLVEWRGHRWPKAENTGFLNRLKWYFWKMLGHIGRSPGESVSFCTVLTGCFYRGCILDIRFFQQVDPKKLDPFVEGVVYRNFQKEINKDTWPYLVVARWCWTCSRHLDVQRFWVQLPTPSSEGSSGLKNPDCIPTGHVFFGRPRLTSPKFTGGVSRCASLKEVTR